MVIDDRSHSPRVVGNLYGVKVPKESLIFRTNACHASHRCTAVSLLVLKIETDSIIETRADPTGIAVCGYYSNWTLNAPGYCIAP
jgi:hypothetical protein